MDKIRSSHFSGSWYPEREEDVRRQIEKYEEILGKAEMDSVSAIVPHAGWYFSGHLAYDAIRRLKQDVDLVLILGGHLPADYPFLFWTDNICNTPLGALEVHKGIRDRLLERLNGVSDDSPDNTIELQLPFIKSHFVDIPIVPLRVPAGTSSLRFHEVLGDVISDVGQSAVVIGSTDLTHYGPNYGYIPGDSIENPEIWVENSDRKILRAMENFRGKDILDLADQDRSACSAGAAAAAALWGKSCGSEKGVLLQYENSLSRHQSSSFVGYGALVYPV
ncbi:AmmeMemoRadiSam system protein B [Spirochaeta isovalerica]|uniref:AmmeMemoRadiSam system protein B n=1 Tax=Spirochaeta isovalerica TaxID=150 RepID=A0A841R4V9_9SPIO|nr:AmmeMemoRadiSam system protein B [Spirochaeta isovalerica]MBB6478905.1 hypothetical protein [Spirochaeta isovalerica]